MKQKSSSLAAILLLSFFRPFVYELLRKMHYALSILSLYGLWRHVRMRAVRITILATGIMFLTATVVQVARTFYRSVNRKGDLVGLVRAEDDVLEAYKVVVKLRRGWKISAGQFVQLYAPSASSFSPFQTHPFVISWWEEDE